MDEPFPTHEELQERFAAMMPPTVPDQVFDPKNPEIYAIGRWKKNFAVAVLAGLSTEPRFHANGVRLDWLLRLVLSKSNGKSKPRRDELSRVLNTGLMKTNVARLEDPIEDLFCELIVTEQGNFRIFSGQWESAGPYTQTLLGAFQSLPDDPRKRDALISVYALLRLSEEIAERAGVHRDQSSNGSPGGNIDLPYNEALWRLADRTLLRDRDLEELGIPRDALAPYIIEPQQYPYVSDREAGETPLEFHPLVPTSKGLILASPANVSVAVRSSLILAATRGGMGSALQNAILEQQERYSEDSNFWPVPQIHLCSPNRFRMRASVCQYDQGSFLHVIQVPVLIDGSPGKGFASIRQLSEEENQFIASDIERFWGFALSQPDCRTLTSVVLLSGWGGGQFFAPPIKEEEAPQNWQYFAMSFADAGVLGVCADSEFRDILRILRQQTRLEADGFRFQNLNGILNLFGFWRETDGNLIPEHMQEIAPPLYLILNTDALLAPRVEAAKCRDVRALPRPDKSSKVVSRIEWDDEDDLRPVYASHDDVKEGRLVGAVLKGGRIWWIESEVLPDENREWRYQVWHAVLQWLDAVGQSVVDHFPASFPVGAALVSIHLPEPVKFKWVDIAEVDRATLHDAIAVIATEERNEIHLQPTWQAHLRFPENDAEVELMAVILRSLSKAAPEPLTIDALKTAILDAVGSRDWRWLHAHEAVRPDDLLSATGLVSQFRKIPFSADCLVKCGSIWDFRTRSDGSEIDGKDACKIFITKYRDAILESLIRDIRQFDRLALCKMCGDRYQGARLDRSHWRRTIRALRAIHGASADSRAFERENSINAVLRATKLTCEIGACEASQTSDKAPSRMELDALFAKALLIFGNVQLYSSIVTDLIPPKLKISPAGDLLSERGIISTVLQRGAEWISRRNLDEAAQEYVAPPVRESSPQRRSLDSALSGVLQAEFHVTAEAYREFQFAAIQLAELKDAGVFSMRRTELANWLAERETFRSSDTAAFLDRLTLPSRAGWFTMNSHLKEIDIDIGRFDRPWSLINRPLLALDGSDDPAILVVPMFISDSTAYCLSGLVNGFLNDRFWESMEARQYAGAQGKAAGDQFEDTLVGKLRNLELKVIPRCKLSAVLNQKVPDDLGDIDALAVSTDRKRVWAIEAKNLRLCRTEAETVARMTQYRGTMITDHRGRQRPDKMLRHIRRVQYLRQHRERLCERLELPEPPEVYGLLVVEAPQPMNFDMPGTLADGQSIFMDALSTFQF